MICRPGTRPFPRLLRFTRLVAIAAGFAILGGGCVWNPASPFMGSRLAGTITLLAERTDPNGTVLEPMADASATGVRVRTLTFAGLRDSSTSVNGDFAVPVGMGFNWLVIGPSAATSDTLGPWFIGKAGVRGLRLRLQGKGTVAACPNPVQQGAALAIRFNVGPAERIVVRIRTLDGRSARTLYDGVLVAGAHAVAWDTKDDGGFPVPAGAYWLTCEGGGAASATPLGALPVSPGVSPGDSRGSRALVFVTGP